MSENIKWIGENKKIRFECWVEFRGDPEEVIGSSDIYAIEGHLGNLDAIQAQVNENLQEDDFFEASGMYLCSASYQEAERYDYGVVGVPAYWDITILDKKLFPKGGEQDEIDLGEFIF